MIINFYRTKEDGLLVNMIASHLI